MGGRASACQVLADDQLVVGHHVLVRGRGWRAIGASAAAGATLTAAGAGAGAA